MLAESTLTSKGQITIPKIIRDRLKLQPGAKVIFTIEGDKVEMSSASGNILDWYGAIKVSETQDLDSIRAQTQALRAEEVAHEAGSD